MQQITLKFRNAVNQCTLIHKDNEYLITTDYLKFLCSVRRTFTNGGTFNQCPVIEFDIYQNSKTKKYFAWIVD